MTGAGGKAPITCLIKDSASRAPLYTCLPVDSKYKCTDCIKCKMYRLYLSVKCIVVTLLQRCCNADGSG